MCNLSSHHTMHTVSFHVSETYVDVCWTGRGRGHTTAGHPWWWVLSLDKGCRIYWHIGWEFHKLMQCSIMSPDVRTQNTKEDISSHLGPDNNGPYWLLIVCTKKKNTVRISSFDKESQTGLEWHVGE